MTDKTHPQEELARRLLGPAGPELGCDECFEELDRFVELELGRRGDANAGVPGMRAPLDGCPACRDAYGSLRALVQAEAEERTPRERQLPRRTEPRRGPR